MTDSTQHLLNSVTPIHTLLVANRGEIAERIFHTCRQLGIRTVAVHSTVDRDAPFVRAADVAVHLPGASPAETYLQADLIINAARQAGADAIHPGYGFLSENAHFAAAVQDADLIWVGPSPHAIQSMGSKLEAKSLMTQAGVPVLGELDPNEVTAEDLPVLIKAASGGGGRGMRVVEQLDDLEPAIASARAEAASAFGDDTVFCEPYLPTGHHIEVQILADRYGTVWTLGERECSIQRRHQKVVEETPSPLISRQPEMREQLFDAAVNAATAIEYEGAGTIEFLATDDGTFFFLEMNTRLQVEHPVTECVWGVDLVAEQIRVAEGQMLGSPPTPSGHAIEARLYAEDPAASWQPQHGRVHTFSLPIDHSRFNVPNGASGLRVDSAVISGSEITIHYDPMIAKVIAVAPTRGDAIRRLRGALHEFQMHGPVTNRDTLINIVDHPAFIAGETPTSFLDDHGNDAMTRHRTSVEQRRLAAIAVALADSVANYDEQESSTIRVKVPLGWRNVRSQPQRKSYVDAFTGHEFTVEYYFNAIENSWWVASSCEFGVGDSSTQTDSIPAGTTQTDSTQAEPTQETAAPTVTVLNVTSSEVRLEVDGVQQRFGVSRYDEPTLTDPHRVALYVDTLDGAIKFTRVPRFPTTGSQVADGTLQAPMPGMVARLAIKVGDHVEAGQPLLWIEAMKMEHQILAPSNGKVAEIYVEANTQVDEGQVLLHVETSTDDDSTQDATN